MGIYLWNPVGISSRINAYNRVPKPLLNDKAAVLTTPLNTRKISMTFECTRKTRRMVEKGAFFIDIFGSKLIYQLKVCMHCAHQN